MADITIKARDRDYTVEFQRFVIKEKYTDLLVIDSRVYELHKKKFSHIDIRNIFLLEALEKNKTLQAVEKITKKLIDIGANRKSRIIAIGGGITQDIVCLTAQLFMRGIDWIFYPTTLLAQADSCIGSKSSINFLDTKNLLGSFYAPTKILIDVSFLQTLDHVQIESGIGEIYKVLLIKDPENFQSCKVEDFLNKEKSEKIILKALTLKQRIIQRDEFDKSERLVMNYGHTIGHALEIASGHKIPHGIAVAIGINLANKYAATVNNSDYYLRFGNIIAPTGQANYIDMVDREIFIKAFNLDKKHTENDYCLIFPENGLVKVHYIAREFDLPGTLSQLLKDY